MTEYWDILDKDGKELGIRWAREDSKMIPEGMYHPVVEIWVRIGDKLLITQRHPNKYEGLKFDLPGGAVVAGESILDGAVRELSEEVGIRVDAERLTELGRMISGNVYATSYILHLDTLPKISLQPTEVVGYRVVSQSEYEAMVESLTKGTQRRYALYKDKIFK